MASEEKEFRIRNVGTVRDFRLRLEPGVTVLRGRNGAGKSTVSRAVVKAAGGTPDAKLEKRDGSQRGEVDGPGGAVLRIGATVRTSGECELELAETSPLVALIDPGIKGAEARLRARMKAIADLVGDRSVTDEDLRALAGDGDETGALYGLLEEVAEGQGNLFGLATEAQKVAHDLALETEKAAHGWTGQGKALEERLEALSTVLAEAVDNPKFDEAQGPTSVEEVDAASRAVYEAEAKAAAREQAEKKLRELGAVDSVDTERDRLKSAQERQQKAAEALDRARARMANANSDVAAAADRLKRATEAEALLAEARADTDAELEQAKENLGKLLASNRYHAVVAEIDEAKANRENQEKQAAALAEVAAKYRTFARSLFTRAGARGLAGLEAWAFENEAITVDGRDFDTRLSDGERIAASLGLALQLHGKGQLYSLGPRWWSSLDPEHQRELHREAKAIGLYLLAEEPTEGDLRAEQAFGNGGEE